MRDAVQPITPGTSGTMRFQPRPASRIPHPSSRPERHLVNRNRDFLKLWAGQTISLFGSQITRLAIPLLAALTLHASPLAMSALYAAGSVPDLAIGLFAGVWVDRIRRRPLLIACDLGRVALLLLIPLVAWLSELSVALLVVIELGVGTLTTIFGIAYQAYLPGLVSRDELVDANSRLSASSSLSEVAGPGLAGGMVQLLTAPAAILVDACSYLVSGVMFVLIRARESPQQVARGGVWQQIGEGLRVVWRTPLLRAIAGCSGTFNFFDSFLLAVYVIYLTRELVLSAGVAGLVFTVGGVGGVLGAVAAGRITERVAVGKIMIGTIVLAAGGELGIALAFGSPLAAASIVAVSEATVQAGAVVFSITTTSLRQAATPDQLLGRVNATLRFMRTGLVPIGALLGGIIAEQFGLRAAVTVAGLGTLLAVGWVLDPRVPSLRSIHDVAS